MSLVRGPGRESARLRWNETLVWEELRLDVGLFYNDRSRVFELPHFGCASVHDRYAAHSPGSFAYS
jgi:hypothetical protein